MKGKRKRRKKRKGEGFEKRDEVEQYVIKLKRQGENESN